MKVRRAVANELSAVVDLRFALWPEDLEDHVEALEDHFAGRPGHIDEVIVAEASDMSLVGLADLRIRNYAEGSEELQVPFSKNGSCNLTSENKVSAQHWLRPHKSGHAQGVFRNWPATPCWIIQMPSPHTRRWVSKKLTGLSLF